MKKEKKRAGRKNSNTKLLSGVRKIENTFFFLFWLHDTGFSQGSHPWVSSDTLFSKVLQSLLLDILETTWHKCLLQNNFRLSIS